MTVNKRPNPIDSHVGNRVRMQRILLKMSQEKLGEALGITFQQVQKYEKGVNRISASRLQQIAQFLNVPPSFFFRMRRTVRLPPRLPEVSRISRLLNMLWIFSPPLRACS